MLYRGCVMDRLQGVLHKMLGTRPEGYARVRLGRGVVGNTTYGLYAVCAAVVGISAALSGNPTAALYADAGVLVCYVLYLAGTYAFAHLHPESAALGDTEWLKWHQSQIAAKDLPTIPVIAPSLDPHSTLQTIEHERKNAT